MPQLSTTRRVHHSASEMFDLVADVEHYPEFVPLCQSLSVRERSKPADKEVIVADMTVAYKLIRETFTSRVTLDRPHLEILVEYLEGPFRRLNNRWNFRPVEDGVCATFGTSVEFDPNPARAAKQAARTQKLLMVLHVSGNFEDAAFT